jgi:hypothetical protein
MMRRLVSFAKTFDDFFPGYIRAAQDVLRLRSGRQLMSRALREKGVDFEVLQMKRDDEWRRDIRTGDILIVRSGGMWGPVIPGYLNHVCIYVGGGKTVEAEERGVIEQDIQVHDSVWRAAEILRVKTKKEVAGDAARFCREQVGKPYDVNWWHKHADPDSRRWSCAELVWAAYWNSSLKHMGRPISLAKDKGWYDKSTGEWCYDRFSTLSPEDIHLSEHTEFISGYVVQGKGKLLFRRKK